MVLALPVEGPTIRAHSRVLCVTKVKSPRGEGIPVEVRTDPDRLAPAILALMEKPEEFNQLLKAFLRQDPVSPYSTVRYFVVQLIVTAGRVPVTEQDISDRDGFVVRATINVATAAIAINVP